MNQVITTSHEQCARDRIGPIAMRIRDACYFTGISRSTLYVLIAAGEIEIVKIGSTTLVLTQSLYQLIERKRMVRQEFLEN